MNVDQIMRLAEWHELQARLLRELLAPPKAIANEYPPPPEDLRELSVRARNGCKRAGVFNIDQLAAVDFHAMLNWRNTGITTRREIRAFLAKYGRCIKNE